MIARSSVPLQIQATLIVSATKPLLHHATPAVSIRSEPSIETAGSGYEQQSSSVQRLHLGRQFGYV